MAVKSDALEAQIPAVWNSISAKGKMGIDKILTISKAGGHPSTIFFEGVLPGKDKSLKAKSWRRYIQAPAFGSSGNAILDLKSITKLIEGTIGTLAGRE